MVGTYADEVRRVLIGRALTSADALIVLVGSFLPWLRSGTRHRNSYDILSLVERIGYSAHGAVGWALRLWPVLPLLLVVAVTLVWSGRHTLAAAAAMIAAVYAGAVSIAVSAASPTGLIAAEYGPWVTLAGAVLLLAGAAITLATNRDARAPGAALSGGRS